MKDLLRTAAILALIFASTFIVLRLLGWLTVDNVRAMLDAAHALDRRLVAAVVIAVLFADLFVAVPTLTTCVLAGYFLGAGAGSLAAAAGMLLAGGSGYLISRRWGERLLMRMLRDPHRLAEMRRAFEGNGFAVLLVCRALPILPEVSCCMAGVTRMPWPRFLTAFVIGTVPRARSHSFRRSRLGSIGRRSRRNEAAMFDTLQRVPTQRCARLTPSPEGWVVWPALLCCTARQGSSTLASPRVAYRRPYSPTRSAEMNESGPRLHRRVRRLTQLPRQPRARPARRRCAVGRAVVDLGGVAAASPARRQRIARMTSAGNCLAHIACIPYPSPTEPGGRYPTDKSVTEHWRRRNVLRLLRPTVYDADTARGETGSGLLTAWRRQLHEIGISP